MAGTAVYTPGNTGPAGTEVMDATGVFDSSGQRPPGPDGLCGTEAMETTGAFAPGAATEAIGATRVYDPTPPTQADPRPGNKAKPVPDGFRCGRYVLKNFHAKGGMGEIWLAEDPEIGRPVR